VAENVENLITDVSNMRSERPVVVTFLITCAAARTEKPLQPTMGYSARSAPDETRR